MSIDEEKILQIYSLRWNIEIYFKICKSYLKLRTESHSTSYHALTAHMIIVALRYMILTMLKFDSSDNRTIQELFNATRREIVNNVLNSNVCFILEAFFESVMEVLRPTEDQMKTVICNFVEKLPQIWKGKFDLALLG